MIKSNNALYKYYVYTNRKQCVSLGFFQKIKVILCNMADYSLSNKIQDSLHVNYFQYNMFLIAHFRGSGCYKQGHNTNWDYLVCIPAQLHVASCVTAHFSKILSASASLSVKWRIIIVPTP